MTTPVFLYDDPADAPRFAPFADSRPIGELRYGAHLLRERVAHAGLGTVAGHVAAPHLALFTEPGAPRVHTDPPRTGPRLFLRSTFVPDRVSDVVLAAPGGAGAVRLCDASGASVGCLLGDGTPWPGAAGIAEGWPTLPPLLGRRLVGAWQLVGDLGPVLRGDIAAARAGRGGRVPEGCTVLGDSADLLVDEDAAIEPHVVFDLRAGPVWIRAGAEVRTFSRLAGPLVVGEGSRIVGGQLRESSIGPRCVVHGEVAASVFVGYANKAHDGFLGHSIVGRWANLGAGTITSNLKNTYGPVRLDLGAERIETGMTFLGALVGDHVKTAIGTMLPTGCVLGAGANVFGTRRPASRVAPFAWGTDEPDRVMACRMFLQTAARVLPRRDVAFDDATRAYLEALWRHATGRPCD